MLGHSEGLRHLLQGHCLVALEELVVYHHSHATDVELPVALQVEVARDLVYHLEERLEELLVPTLVEAGHVGLEHWLVSEGLHYLAVVHELLLDALSVQSDQGRGHCQEHQFIVAEQFCRVEGG